MTFRKIEKCDENIFMSLCECFYSSGATTRGFDKDLAKKTFDYLESNHENLWGYLFHDKESGEPVGYALVTSYWCNEDGGNVIILDELYISEAHRKHGYGKHFLEWLEGEFSGKAVSITLEVLTSNTKAKELYRKVGFTEDGFEVLTKHL